MSDFPRRVYSSSAQLRDANDFNLFSKSRPQPPPVCSALGRGSRSRPKFVTKQTFGQKQHTPLASRFVPAPKRDANLSSKRRSVGRGLPPQFKKRTNLAQQVTAAPKLVPPPKRRHSGGVIRSVDKRKPRVIPPPPQPIFPTAERIEEAYYREPPPLFEASPRQRAGDAAELSVTQEARLQMTSMFTGQLVFANVRVPDELKGGRREIDVVILSPYGVFCVEVKHWSGRKIRCERDRYFQYTRDCDELPSAHDEAHTGNSSSYGPSSSAPSGTARSHPYKNPKEVIRVHPNPVTQIKMKAELTHSYLKRYLGMANAAWLAQSNLVRGIVFFTGYADLEYAEGLQDGEFVVGYGEVKSFLASLRDKRGIWRSWLDRFLPQAWRTPGVLLDNAALSAVGNALASLGTWDVLELRGGKKLKGDFHFEGRIGEAIHTLGGRQAVSELRLSHLHGREVWLRFRRSLQVFLYHEERCAVRLVPRSRRTIDLPSAAPLSLCAVAAGVLTKLLFFLGAPFASKQAAGVSIIAAVLAAASYRWRALFACPEVAMPRLVVVKFREAGCSADTEILADNVQLITLSAPRSSFG